MNPESAHLRGSAEGVECDDITPLVNARSGGAEIIEEALRTMHEVYREASRENLGSGTTLVFARYR